MVGLSERAARPLFAIRDEKIREIAITKCSERLNGKIGAGRDTLPMDVAYLQR
jgi:hypothetical protein